MFQLKADHVLAVLVDQLLPGMNASRTDTRYVENGLYVQLRCTLKKWVKAPDEDDEDGDGDWEGPHTCLHYLISRVGGSTKVFCCVDSDYGRDPSLYQLRSCHDSCWRSDGFRDIREVYFNLRDKLAAEPGQSTNESVRIDKVERKVLFIELGKDAFGPNRYKLVGIENPDPK